MLRRCGILLVMLVAAAVCDGRVSEVPADIPVRAQRLDGYAGRQQLCRHLAARPLDAVEGIWQFGTPGTEIAVVRTVMPGTTSAAYAMVCVRGGVYAIAPGTILGYLLPAAPRGEYDAYIYTRAEGTTLTAPRRYAVRADGDGLTFTEVHSGYRITPGRLFSRIFVVGISHTDNTPDDHRGCRRIYPPSDTDTPMTPIYL